MSPKRGSITLFLTVSLTIVIAVIFVFLECARVWGISQKADTDAEMTKSSVMAEYTKNLYEDYDLLFLDGSYMSGTFDTSNLSKRAIELSKENLQYPTGLTTGMDLYYMQPTAFSVSKYTLATDNSCKALIKECADVMETMIPAESVEYIKNYLNGDDGTGDDDSSSGTSRKEDVSKIDTDPSETVSKVKKIGILSLVTPDGKVSAKKMTLSGLASKRSLNKGKGTTSIKSKSTERILFQQYLLEYFSNYKNDDSGKNLDYEVEYIISGKSSDEANLRSVVNQLIAMRESANMLFLEKDVKRREIIAAAAASISAAALSPEAEPVIEQGIMAAWAYAESVSDVKLLLDGQKVRLVKTESQWHTGLSNLEKNMTEDNTIKQKEGLDYEQYLNVLMWSKNEKKLALRAMDLIEKEENIKMDNQIVALSGTITYSGSPLFSTFVSVGKNKLSIYSFQREYEGNYIEQ